MAKKAKMGERERKKIAGRGRQTERNVVERGNGGERKKM